MSEMLLLGAGSSVEAGVPDSYNMTERMTGLLRQDVRFERHAHVAAFVVGGLLFQQGIKGEDPLTNGVNIEDLFNAMDLLSKRNALEAAPFVGSWHSMVELLDKEIPYTTNPDRLHRAIYDSVTKEILRAFPNSPPAFAVQDIDRAFRDATRAYSSSGVGSFDRIGTAVNKLITGITSDWLRNLSRRTPSSSEFRREFESALESTKERPSGGKIFSETNEIMLSTLAKIVWIDKSERVDYLKPILNVLNRQNKLVIASLNYDNSVELLAESLRIPCPTGIEEWSERGNFSFPNEGVVLLKLHGSIDWSLARGQRSEQRPMPHSKIRRIPASEVLNQPLGARPAVVFGQRNKLTVEGPFLDLLRFFEEELSKSDRLTVVGYSFRDSHVNEYISQWLNQSSKNQLRIIDPQFPNSDVDYTIQLKKYCTPQLEIINEKTGSGLNQAFGDISVTSNVSPSESFAPHG